MSDDLKSRIIIDSTVHFGKPCVAGTRISVDSVLELVQEGMSFAEIIDSFYPDLHVEDIKACIDYATNLIRHEEIHVRVA